jgi:hypothetical protein
VGDAALIKKDPTMRVDLEAALALAETVEADAMADEIENLVRRVRELLSACAEVRASKTHKTAVEAAQRGIAGDDQARIWTQAELDGESKPVCTCHERDGSQVCDVCWVEGHRGHTEEHDCVCGSKPDEPCALICYRRHNQGQPEATVIDLRGEAGLDRVLGRRDKESGGL